MQNLGSIHQLGAELWANSHTKVSFAISLFNSLLYKAVAAEGKISALMLQIALYQAVAAEGQKNTLFWKVEYFDLPLVFFSQLQRTWS